MKWFVPREHGAWAMLIVPFMLGMLASKVTLLHFVFFVGVLSFYFSSGPLLAYIRQPKLKYEVVPALSIYLTAGFLFTIPVIYLFPKIILISLLISPFFALNLIFAKRRKERLFVNDLSAIIALSFLVIISYYIGLQTMDERVFLLMAINILFFTASVFHVKTLIREKGNRVFLLCSNIFHGLLIAFFWLLQLPLVASAFAIGAIKAWLIPKEKRHKPLQIGLLEIANSVVFVAIVGYFY